MDMAHDHHAGNDTGGIRLAFFLNLGFTLFEIVGGLLTNSVSVLSDALHDLGDSISLGLAWFLENFSHRTEDQQYSYGYRRFSLLGALINAVILIGGSLFILSEAIPRLTNPESFHAPGMILLAVVGIIVNGIGALRLRQDASHNARVVGWHLLEDVLGWAVILVVGVVSLFVDLPILDPILSILITLYILFNVLSQLRKVASLFLQAVPEDVDLDDVQARLRALPDVQSVHHTHIWSLDGVQNVLTTHLVIDENTSREDVVQLKCASIAAVQDLNLAHTTIEIEYQDEDCPMRAH